MLADLELRRTREWLQRRNSEHGDTITAGNLAEFCVNEALDFETVAKYCRLLGWIDFEFSLRPRCRVTYDEPITIRPNTIECGYSCNDLC